MVRVRRINRRTTIQFSILYDFFNRVRNGANGSRGLFLCENWLNNAGRRRFCEKTQVMAYAAPGFFFDGVTAEAYPILIKLEGLLRRYPWKKVDQNYCLISHGLDGRRMSRSHDVISMSRTGRCNKKHLLVPTSPI